MHKYRIQKKSDTNTAVMIPANESAMPLIAPISSPISIALDVPMTWLAVPIATPVAILDLTLKSFTRSGASMFPITPVKIRAVTVRLLMPPRESAIATAIGVVTLLGTRDAESVSSSQRREARRSITATAEMLPAIVPARIETKCAFTVSLCLYIE